jgi:putative endonuclease
MMFWVYILASQPGGTLYVGVTNDLIRRVFEHREGLVRGFAKRYGVKMLGIFRAARDGDRCHSKREEHQALVA